MTTNVLRITALDLEASSREALPYLNSSGFQELARLVVGDDGQALTFPQAGHLLAAAIISPEGPEVGHATASRLLLCGATVWAPEALELQPSAVHAHPLLSRWVRDDFGAAIGDLLLAGAIWTQLAPDSPIYQSAEATHAGGGVVGAQVAMLFHGVDGDRPISVTARYGSDVRYAAVRHTVNVGASALISLGEQLTLLPDSEGDSGDSYRSASKPHPSFLRVVH